MDFLKAQFTRIQQQLAGLSATQKMLVFSLLTIMVMTLLWWSHWAAEPEMSPLLENQTLTTEDIGQIAANLDSRDIPHQLINNTIYVPADRKIEVMAVLGYSNALPRNFEDGFSSIVKEMNWLDPPDKTDQMFLRAKEQTLEEMIRLWPGVSGAAVVIDDTVQRHIGDNDVQPVATVTISLNRNIKSSNKQLAESAADVVCGAKAGLVPSNVRVIIDGQPFQVRDHTDDGGGGVSDDAIDMQKSYEDYYRDKIQAALQDIRGAMVSVTVKVDTSISTTTIHKVDPKQTVSVQSQSEDSAQEQDAQQAAQQEPGAVPNTEMSLPSASGGGGGGSNNTVSKSSFNTDFSKTDQWVRQPSGTTTVAAASVRVPRSYFVSAYKNENNGKESDDPAALNAYINTQLTQIHDTVKGCAVFPSDDALFVGVYSDQPQPDLPVSLDAAASPITSALGRHGKEAGVGVLALISLFMVSMMVRKGGSTVIIEAGGPEAPPAADTTKNLDGNEGVVGSASEDNATMDGMELDEEAVQAQRTLDQVQKMVDTNPDAAANLVKRWLNR